MREQPKKFLPESKKLIRELFIYRRKQVASVLKKIELGGIPAEAVDAWLETLPRFGCAGTDRPECIPCAAWLALDEKIRALLQGA